MIWYLLFAQWPPSRTNENGYTSQRFGNDTLDPFHWTKVVVNSCIMEALISRYFIHWKLNASMYSCIFKQALCIWLQFLAISLKLSSIVIRLHLIKINQILLDFVIKYNKYMMNESAQFWIPRDQDTFLFMTFRHMPSLCSTFSSVLYIT